MNPSFAFDEQQYSALFRYRLLIPKDGLRRDGITEFAHLMYKTADEPSSFKAATN